MKKEHYKNLRYCEKLKESECFIEADSLQKKIRNFKAAKEHQPIDAELKMMEIESFWKEGWEYNRTHHTYIEPRITIPTVFIVEPSQAPRELQRYYRILKGFVNKLKIEHEDETNYRISLKNYPIPVEHPYLAESSSTIAQHSLEHLLKLFTSVTNDMYIHFQESQGTSSDLMFEQLDPVNKNSFQFCNSLCQNILSCSRQQESSNSAAKQAAESFISFMIAQISQAKDVKMKMSVVGVQPCMGELTYILHPMCFAIYGLFAHETVLKIAKKRRGKQYADEIEEPLIFDCNDIPFSRDQLLEIKDNFKVEQERHSKVIFLNLDGYQSQFTLEMVRNYPKHLMYVSFPKYSTSGDENYNRRFHKKIMYYQTRPEGELFYGDQSGSLTFQREQLLQNPQHYHQVMETLYTDPMGDANLNDNVYVFPIKLPNIHSEKEPSEPYKDIEPYESHFIRFMFRDHLYSQMVKFRPTSIIVSYSGRLVIENDHFLEMTQELSKICSKVTLFPNFTTALAREKVNSHLEDYGNIPTYDKVYHDVGRHLLTTHDQGNRLNCEEADLFDKLAIFLKVSGGFYNLNRPFENQSFESKYKNCQIFPHAIHLFHALKDEYPHCQQRIKRDSLQIALKTMQRGVEEHEQQLARCVPAYYQELFVIVQKQLLNGDGRWRTLLDEWQGRAEQMKGSQEQLARQWIRFRTGQSLCLANAKYHETSYIQLQNQVPKKEFEGLKTQKMNNLDNLLKLSFYLKKRNAQILKIYSEATLHYTTLQYNLKAIKDEFYLIMTQVLSLDEDSYQTYAATPKIDKSDQRCFLVPVVFCDEKGVIEKSKFLHWTEWNYSETNNYILLYWPQEFNHIDYYLHKFMKRNYEPKLTDHIFICQKGQDYPPRGQKALFHKLCIPQELNVIPRWGCSAYFLEDQLFIFGGFHGREISYLDLQNQISTIDLTDFRPSSYQPRKIFHLRKQLYSGQAFNGHVRTNRTPNSFVRPRLQFQFYDYQDLNLNADDLVEEGIRKVIMIGGYGQDFKTPHSLFVNYYYILRFDILNRRLVSVHKQFIKDKVVPLNIKGAMRNRGIFSKGNLLEQGQGEGQKCREGFSRSNHYLAHRIVFAIKNGNLLSKTKNLYALQLFETCKRDYAKFGELMGQVRPTTEPQLISLHRVESNNHHLVAQIRDELYLYSLYLQLNREEVEVVPLLNQRIICMDTRQFTVYALVCHPIYTNSQTLLAVNTLSEPDPLIQERHLALVLKPLETFHHNLNLHSLIICNQNQIAVLQGLAFEGNTRTDMLLKLKSTTTQGLKREQKLPPTISTQAADSIRTFFLRRTSVITSTSFLLSEEEAGVVAVIRQKLDLNRFDEGWKDEQIIKGVVFTHKGVRLRPSMMELKVQSNETLFLLITVESGRHISTCYFMKWTVQGGTQRRQWEVAEVQGTEDYRLKHLQSLPYSFKTIDRYEDFEYWK